MIPKCKKHRIHYQPKTCKICAYCIEIIKRQQWLEKQKGLI
jgi:hypothetical protein